MEEFWPIQFLGVIEQENALIEKRIKSERQDKGSQALLTAERELQLVPGNLFMLMLNIVLLIRFNYSKRTGFSDRKTSFSDRKTSPPQNWR